MMTIDATHCLVCLVSSEASHAKIQVEIFPRIVSPEYLNK